METLSRLVLGHRVLVVVFSLAAVLVGLASAALVAPKLTSDFPHSGVDAWEANQAIVESHSAGGEERPSVAVIVLPSGSNAADPDTARTVGKAFAALADTEDARTHSYADTEDPALLGDDGRTTAGLVYFGAAEDGSPPGGGLGEVPDRSPAIEETLLAELPAGSAVHATGLDALAPGEDAGGLNVPVKIAVTSLAAIVVLALVFRSGLAFLPFLIALVAIPLSFTGLLLFTLVGDVHTQAMTLLPLLGLGLAIDYALVLTTRWREELARGYAGDEAVHRSMATAGRSVLFSAGTVAIGLAVMLFLPVMFLRSLGAAGLLIAGASALVTLTLLPVLLARLGRSGGTTAAVPRADRGWAAWGKAVVRWRYPAALVTGGALAALCVLALDIDMGVPDSRDLAGSGPAHAGVVALDEAGIGRGVLTPVQVLVPAGTDADRVAADVAADPGVATALTGPPAADGSRMLEAVPTAETGTTEGVATIDRLVNLVPDEVMVGGYAAQNAELVAQTYGAFPWVLLMTALVTFVLLARAFRSLVLAIKAILCNLLSLGAVLGAMVVVWQWGIGTEALLGLEATGTVGQFVPITIFAFLYGLSMDYEVFILARMRESRDRGASTERAVIDGVARTGRLVTSAALILFFSFAAMASGGELDVAVFATGMGLGILIDATLVRGVLVPATVAMMGRWNWWLPGWAARLLRVEPAPLPKLQPPDRPRRGGDRAPATISAGSTTDVM
ncbi:RND superfamily putative drug exporter [Lipingzhangella halophila]|uniref:RND superfamily putative drug exporter n=1 Tax=Lipingzhangella halophila TaxID=1783352 RepID=A0A7W7RCV5_9ACTN|nr:MMPL family transporter [Lipingzhangella halophila]MBB4929661.1 RND superfamily putative drug exporter [Lipingzhangella halophila]